MAETNGLLNRHTGITGIEGSNPSVSAIAAAEIIHLLQPNRANGGTFSGDIVRITIA